MTSEDRVAKRPKGRVLVDYNQNAWDGRSHRLLGPPPPARRDVSDADYLERVERAFRIEDFRIDNVRPAIQEEQAILQAAAAEERNASISANTCSRSRDPAYNLAPSHPVRSRSLRMPASS